MYISQQHSHSLSLSSTMHVYYLLLSTYVIILCFVLSWVLRCREFVQTSVTKTLSIVPCSIVVLQLHHQAIELLSSIKVLQSHHNTCSLSVCNTQQYIWGTHYLNKGMVRKVDEKKTNENSERNNARKFLQIRTCIPNEITHCVTRTVIGSRYSLRQH